MHVLDNHVNDIELRIEAICENSNNQEEPSIPESLAAYGWVLLDSWIAWRTMRFLIKDLDIDDTVLKKWFQTPGSYTASQIKAVWNLCAETEEYVRETTNYSLKQLLDDTVQKKRNSAAHYNGRSEITGLDCININTIFHTLSKVFWFHEFKCFISVIAHYFRENKYNDYKIILSNEMRICLCEMDTKFKDIIMANEIVFSCKDEKNNHFYILFSKDGCKTRVNESDYVYIGNDRCQVYTFDTPKGYYRDSELFVKTVFEIWEHS